MSGDPDDIRPLQPEDSQNLDGFVAASQPSKLEQARRNSLRQLHNLEAWLGAFTGTLLSFLFVSFLLLPNNLAVQLPALAYLGLVIGLGCIFEGPFLLRVWKVTLSRQRPIGPAVANLTRSPNVLLRIFAILWWGAHVTIAMFCIVGFEVQILRKAGNQPILVPIIMGLLVFGMSVCCNVFIALLVKSLFGNDRAVEVFWRWRLIIDTCLTALALLVASRL